jgi:leucyl aminopeptidase
VVTFAATDGTIADAEADLLVIGATRSPEADDADGLVAPILDEVGVALGERLGHDLAEACRVAAFDGAVGTSLRLPTRGQVPASLVLVVGLGPANDVTPEVIRRACAPAAEASARMARMATSLHVTAGVDATDAARAVVEGITLAAYRFASYKTDDDGHALAEVSLVGGDVDAATAGIQLGQVSADATVLVRDLVNTPPGDKRPPDFADRARDLVADLPVEVSVMDAAALEAGGYGGHLGVGAGSDVEPCLVELRYRPDGASRHVALVGKGITFDTGGLSLKPPKAMEWMKVDMAGAATVLATIRAAAQLELPVAITGPALPRGEHAVRHRDPARGRAAHQGRHHRRGAQHRRGGAPGPGRRPGARGRTGTEAGRDRGRGDPDRRGDPRGGPEVHGGHGQRRRRRAVPAGRSGHGG